jgi:hypothetical protein
MSCLITILWLSALTLTILKRFISISKRTKQLNRHIHEQESKKGKSQNEEEAGKEGDHA